MACQITELCIGCYNCEPVCPRKAIVEAGGRFIIKAIRCNECRENTGGPRCRLVCPVEGAICASVS